MLTLSNRLLHEEQVFGASSPNLGLGRGRTGAGVEVEGGRCQVPPSAGIGESWLCRRVWRFQSQLGIGKRRDRGWCRGRGGRCQVLPSAGTGESWLSRLFGRFQSQLGIGEGVFHGSGTARPALQGQAPNSANFSLNLGLAVCRRVGACDDRPRLAARTKLARPVLKRSEKRGYRITASVW
jgi:hypothetical protein